MSSILPQPAATEEARIGIGMLQRPAWLIIAALALFQGNRTSGQDIAAGQLLVATAKSRDSEFAHTVVLLVHNDQQGAIGVVLTRPSDVRMSRVFPELKDAKIGTDPVYLGGPVGLRALSLLRSRAAPEKSLHLFADVYEISDHHQIERIAAEALPSSVFRVFVGYTGWSLQQLQNEVSQGLWNVRPGSAAVIFDPHPGTLWMRLSRSDRSPPYN